MNMKETIMSNKTIFILEFYLLFTFILYLTGPFEYSYLNLWNMVFLVATYQVALFYGYYYAKKKDLKGDNNKVIIFNDKNYLVVLMGLTCLSILINYIHIAYIIGDFNLLNFVRVLWDSINEIGDAYLKNIERGRTLSESGHIITKIYTLFSPFLHLSIVLTFIKINGLKLIGKILVTLNLLLTIALPLVKGQNFGVFSFFIIFITILLVYFNKKSINKRKVFGIIFIMLAVFLFYFSVGTVGRLKPNDTLSSIHGINIDSGNWMLSITSQVLHNPIILINGYLTQGYHGMSIAIGESFTSTYGLGNGFFSLRIADMIFGIDLFERTFPSKISKLWHPTINWHTAYTWFANDVSFLGVVVVMLILGFVFSKILKYAIKGDIISIALLPLYIIMILFLPMNNVILGNSTTAFQFIILNAVFIISRRKNLILKAL